MEVPQRKSPRIHRPSLLKTANLLGGLLNRVAQQAAISSTIPAIPQDRHVLWSADSYVLHSQGQLRQVCARACCAGRKSMEGSVLFTEQLEAWCARERARERAIERGGGRDSARETKGGERKQDLFMFKGHAMVGQRFSS